MRWTSLFTMLGASLLTTCGPGSSGTPQESEPVAAAAFPGPWNGSPASSQDATMPVVRRVWGNRNVDLSGDVSYDGRELVFMDYETGDVAVRNLRTGETRRLTDKGSWEESMEYGMHPKMSRDGRMVAFTWALPYGNSERYELRVVGMNGSGLRTLFGDESVGWIEALAWFPDGDRLLASAHRGGLRQILQISIPDGTSRILKTEEPGHGPGHMSVSPNGQSVAFNRVTEEGSESRDIFLMAADGTRETPLVEHPGDDFILDWTPDGEHILFASDRQGTLGAWLLRLEDGEPSGEPVLVRPDMWRMTPIGFTEDGSYYYLVNTLQRTVYLANLDPATGEFLSTPAPIREAQLGSRTVQRPSWSPDGRSLAFQEVRSSPEAEGPKVFVRSTESGETREITPRRLKWIIPSFWSRDGRFIFGLGPDVQDRFGFHRVNVLTGETESFPNFWGVNVAASLGLSSDGQSLFYKGWLDDGAGVVVRGLEGGMSSLLYRWTGSNYNHAVLSPAGEFLAMGEIGADGGVLLLMSASGGSPEVLVQFPPGGGGPEQIAWTPDSEHIVYRNGQEIWSVPRVGGEPRKLEWPIEESLMGALRDIAFSPDGRRIAFDAVSGQQELWVMENFLPGH